MKIICCDTANQAAKEAAHIVAGMVNGKPDCTLGLPTGETPLLLYKELIEMNKQGSVDFEKVTTFNLDEYYPIEPTHSQSYRYFMDTNFFDHINIDKKCTHILNGLAEDPDAECKNYDKQIEAAGGIDLQVLGIGQNGHIAFNEPDEKLVYGTHLTSLTENTLEANSRFFDSVDEVPKQALTSGLGTIMNARKIILIATGKAKHNALKEFLEGYITTANPATMLHFHKDVTVICDKDAYEG